jgi:hypothetical protein
MEKGLAGFREFLSFPSCLHSAFIVLEERTPASCNEVKRAYSRAGNHRTRPTSSLEWSWAKVTFPKTVRERSQVQVKCWQDLSEGRLWDKNLSYLVFPQLSF